MHPSQVLAAVRAVESLDREDAFVFEPHELGVRHVESYETSSTQADMLDRVSVGVICHSRLDDVCRGHVAEWNCPHVSVTVQCVLRLSDGDCFRLLGASALLGAGWALVDVCDCVDQC